MATLTLVAALLAEGATTLLGAAITLAPRLRDAHGAAANERGDRAAIGCTILARNAFDSSTGAIDCEGPDVDIAITGEGGARPEPSSCDASIRLVATYVERDGDASRVALIRDATGGSLLYSPGMSIGEQVVVSIDPERVALRRNELDCTLALFEGAPAPPVAATAAPAPARAATALPAGARMVGDRLEISAATITRAIADPRSLAGSLRAAPVAGGLRLSGITPEHPLAQLGVRSGDVVRAIDGAALDGPDAYLAALTAIRRTGAHAIQLSREGRAVSVGIDVQP